MIFLILSARKQHDAFPKISNTGLIVRLMAVLRPLPLFQVDKPVSRTKPKKAPTTTTGKMVKKAKEKQISQSVKKKPSAAASEPKPEGAVTKKSKEISNRLAEAKQ